MPVNSYFSDDVIAEVRAASDIVDVVSDYVRLKKKGANFFGLCPFHQEKTPSFSVNSELGSYKCFGCGAGGDVFRFVREMEGMSFPEAVRTLAEKAGVELPEAGDASRERADAMEAAYGALRFAARFYYERLTRSASGRQALAYVEGRGYSKEIVKEFGVGYAPDGWSHLLDEAKANHISVESLEQAGLVIPKKSGGGYYDRYRDRIMFPVFSHMGKVLGFGGRVLKESSGEQENPSPKYINSPETIVYDKRRVLYGLRQARQVIREREESVLVEGYTDVMSLHQAGVRNAVASCGTSLTREQVQLLSRYAQRIALVFDADGAGENAARRGIDLALAAGMSVYVVALPEGEDPDSVAQREGASLQEFMKANRVDFVRWMHDADLRAGRLDAAEGRQHARRAPGYRIHSRPAEPGSLVVPGERGARRTRRPAASCAGRHGEGTPAGGTPPGFPGGTLGSRAIAVGRIGPAGQWRAVQNAPQAIRRRRNGGSGDAARRKDTYPPDAPAGAAHDRPHSGKHEPG